MLKRSEIEDAARLVHAVMAPTPQYAWPLLGERAGVEVWGKHENHTPTGAFKVRGGIVLMEALKRRDPPLRGIVSATRGNHGQSLAWSACRAGVRTVIVVPRGNSRSKNAAMRAWGAELIEHGHDFDEAREHAAEIAARDGLEMIGPFRRELVAGVSTYALEFFNAAPDLDTVYVPVGCGSGICGLISARDALGLRARIVGVVSAQAPAYALSFKARQAVETETANTFADGVAVRVPVPEALEIIWRGAADIVQVTDDEVKQAMRVLFDTTHNVIEPAGATPLAALLKSRPERGRRYGVILSGGNVDRDVYASVIAGDTAGT